MVTPLFYPVRGGTEIHVLNLSKALKEIGINVVVHTTRNTYTEKRSLERREYVDGIEIIRHDYTWYPGNGADIIHVHNMARLFSLWNFSTSLFLLGSHREGKIFTPHDSFLKQRNKIIQSIQKKIVKNTSFTIAVSEWERDSMTKMGFPKEKIKVVSNGVEEKAFELPKQSRPLDEPYLLFLARISREKNQLFSIKCMEKIDGIKLLLAGDIRETTYMEEINNTIKSLKLENKVKYIGRIEDDKKYSYIDNALALVLTSTMEADPIVIREGLVRGVPAIVGNFVGAFSHLIKHEYNGFVVGNCEEFYQAVQKLKDEKMRERLSINSKTGTENWRWRNIATNIKTIYEESLKK
ncbi:glycosylation protein Agl16 [Sulfuracidifex tepidarius]|nr:glycosylation protein Agl16 [Sulfuracidifex tepidarius]